MRVETVIRSLGEYSIQIIEFLVNFVDAGGESLPSNPPNLHLLQFEELLGRVEELFDGVESLQETVVPLEYELLLVQVISHNNYISLATSLSTHLELPGFGCLVAGEIRWQSGFVFLEAGFEFLQISDGDFNFFKSFLNLNRVIFSELFFKRESLQFTSI